MNIKIQTAIKDLKKKIIIDLKSHDETKKAIEKAKTDLKK